MLTLQILRAEAGLRFRLQRADHTAPVIAAVSEAVCWPDVEAQSERLLESVARELRGAAAHKALAAVGRELFGLLIPQRVAKILCEIPQGEDVWLSIDAKLVQFPWELLHDGEEFLCTRFNLSRAVETAQEVAERRAPPELSALIIGDPEHNLKAAREEVKELGGLLAGLQRVADTGPVVTREFVKEHLPACSVLHYSGHSEYDPVQPSRSGWRLANGRLTCEDIERLGRTQVAFPRLIFSNSCSSAETRAWEEHEKHIYGLVHAFLGAGVQCYLGSFTTIPDSSAPAFAKAFYTDLLAGATVGEAVRKARQTLRDANPDNLTWASYVLYGDPRYRLVRRTKIGSKRPAHEAREALPKTRGKLSLQTREQGSLIEKTDELARIYSLLAHIKADAANLLRLRTGFGILLCLVASFLYSTANVISRYLVVNQVDPLFLATGWSCVEAFTLFFMSLIAPISRSDHRRVEWMNLPSLCIVLSLSLEWICYVFALRYITASQAIILYSLDPWWVFLILLLFFRREANRFGLIGTLLAVLGAYVNVVGKEGKIHIASLDTVGSVLALAGGLAYAIRTVSQNKHPATVDDTSLGGRLRFLAKTRVGSTMVLLLVMLGSGFRGSFEVRTVIAICILGVTGSAIAAVVFEGLKRVSSLLAAVLSPMDIAITVILETTILGAVIPGYVLLGGTLIVLGTLSVMKGEMSAG